MKVSSAALLMAASLATIFASGPVRASTSDDARWIAQCVRDNKDEGQPGPVVAAYCACMVEAMPESETRSVTQWEKTHKREENRCGAQAGWRGR
jgi:hypothetical protein